MAKFHVLLKKEELDREKLPGKVVVVIDVLFATSTIVTALAHGASEVLPAPGGDAARALAAGLPAGSFVLAGELDAETLPGFTHPTPLALLDAGVEGKTVVYSTTNGTVAFGKASQAARVLAGSLLNGEALADRLAETSRGETVLLVCAGSAEAFNLEDFYGAGYLVSLLASRLPGNCELSDAALAAMLLHDRHDALDVLSRSRIGRMMLGRGAGREVAFAAQKSRYQVVPELTGGRLTVMTPGTRQAP
ncbi:MAG TPA: 2-phosphosulfolactate phosphatase [Anaeromyxobacteraceae bacterium]|nr:2-phosphosulfolactate phosphatase [Anaeromyxobacteraceae bacterium]